MKKTAKGFLGWVLALMLLAGMLTVTSLAASPTSGTCGAEGDGSNLTWTLSADGTLTISGSGAMRDYTGSATTPWSKDIVSVVLESGVTSIGKCAFQNCKKMRSIVIPEGVTTIGTSAFTYCESLSSITLPASLSYMSGSSFRGCVGLTSVTVALGSKDYISVDGVLFHTSWKTSLALYPANRAGTDYSVPEGITDLDGGSFCDCKNLVTLSLPASIKTIYGSAIQSCQALQSISVAEGNESFCTVDGILFSKDMKTIVRYPCQKEGGWYAVPAGVETVESYAFESCEKLIGVAIPSGVTKIGYDAFYNCKNMTDLTIPDTVTEVGSSAFASCTKLNNVTLPAGVTTIETGTFSGCTSLTNVKLPESLISLKSNAFYRCSALKDLQLPNGLKKIEKSAFAFSGLTMLTIPSNVTEVSDGVAFASSSLSAITVASGNPNYTAVNGVLFDKDMKRLVQYPAGKTDTNYTIPNGVTAIGERAFQGVKTASVTLPSGVTEICKYAFQSSSLTDITIPASVTSVGEKVFNSCKALKNVYFGGSEAQWRDAVGNADIALQNAAVVHYGSAAPAVQPAVNVSMALARTQAVTVDGQEVTFQAYALADPATGYETNYVKLRDVAHALNGTAAQFQVGWDGSVTVTTGTAYTPNGSENNTPFSGDRAYAGYEGQTVVNGAAAPLEAIVLTDDNGGGYTYYKLRDLGKALGFNVGWNGGIFIQSNAPYSDAD